MKGKSSRLLVGLLVGLLVFSSAGFAYAEQGRPPAGRGERRGAMLKGEVTAVDGAALSVQTEHRGEVTVQTNANTRFRTPDGEELSLADIQVGDTIGAKGRFTAENTLAARAVVLIPPELADTVRGKVTAIEGNTIAIEDKDGNATDVVTSAETQFRVRGQPDASIDDIEVGMLLSAAGQFDASRALIAKHIVAGEAREPRQRRLPKGGPVAGGQVSKANGDEFVLSYPDDSTLTVTTDASTLVVKRGENGPALGSLSDVSQGARILALGVPSEDGSSLAARVILVGFGRHAGDPRL